MWSITISLDNAQPKLVMVRAIHVDGFSYAENLYLDKFNTESFVREAIAKRDKWIVDRENTLSLANAIAKEITTALNQADGIKVELETITDSNNISCAKIAEPIKEII